MGQPESLLIDQAAALLGVSRRTVYYRIREGLLWTVKTRCGSQRVLMASIEEQLRVGPRRRRKPPRSGAGGPGEESGELQAQALPFEVQALS